MHGQQSFEVNTTNIYIYIFFFKGLPCVESVSSDRRALSQIY